MGNIVIGQSGGPTSVINSSLYGAIVEAKNQGIKKIYGMKNGIGGLISDNLIDLTDIDDKKLELLKQTPSSILGSIRYHLDPKDKEDDFKRIIENCIKYDIEYILYIGGNDSMDSVLKLSDYFKKVNFNCKVIGAPKTIDNDLDITDHAPGFGSAAKFIANSIVAIKEDTSVYEKGRVTIVEIMGRDAGWLTAASKLASLNGNGPELIYLPEVPFDKKKFLNDVVNAYGKNQKCLVCISEGIRNAKGKYIVNDFAYIEDNDVFGHMQLGGSAEVLTHIVKDKLSIPVRAIELNLLQRSLSNLSSLTDINEAIESSSFAVKSLVDGETGKMVILKRKNQKDYEIEYVLEDISNVANKVKNVPKEWIVNGNDVNQDFIDYCLPLIQGELEAKYEDGIIKYFKF